MYMSIYNNSTLNCKPHHIMLIEISYMKLYVQEQDANSNIVLSKNTQSVLK